MRAAAGADEAVHAHRLGALAGSVKSVISSASATASTIAPPMPWIARATTSGSCALEMPQASEAPVKRTMPMMKTRR